MGFCCETNSEILNFEERRESVILSYSGDERHVFPTQILPDPGGEVKTRIKHKIMKQAMDLFASGDDERADVYREVANSLDGMDLNLPSRPRSVEITKEYMRDLHRFMNENPGRIDLDESKIVRIATSS